MDNNPNLGDNRLLQNYMGIGFRLLGVRSSFVEVRAHHLICTTLKQCICGTNENIIGIYEDSITLVFDPTVFNWLTLTGTQQSAGADGRTAC